NTADTTRIFQGEILGDMRVVAKHLIYMIVGAISNNLGERKGRPDKRQMGLGKQGRHRKLKQSKYQKPILQSSKSSSAKGEDERKEEKE
ncbi:hypothetical protein BGZ46_004668, partial [Entomortierella lignicola]